MCWPSHVKDSYGGKCWSVNAPPHTRVGGGGEFTLNVELITYNLQLIVACDAFSFIPSMQKKLSIKFILHIPAHNEN